MARVKHITKARASKKNCSCAACGHLVQVGEPYKYVAKRIGPVGGYRMNFCKDCSPRQSHLLSGRSAELAAGGESFEDSIGQLDQSDPGSIPGLVEALEGAAAEIEQMAQDIQSAAQNIEEGFGRSTIQSENMAETANELREWAEKVSEAQREIESADFSENGGGQAPEDYFAQADEAMGEEPELNLVG